MSVCPGCGKQTIEVKTPDQVKRFDLVDAVSALVPMRTVDHECRPKPAERNLEVNQF